MTSTVSRTPQQTQQVLEQAQAAALAIANSATTSIGPNQFVFFAAFDGTDNAYVPVNGDTQNTAIGQLFDQVKGGNGPSQTAAYYEGVGTPGTLSGSDWWPSDVTAQNIQTAQHAYDAFALVAFNWLLANHGGSVTSMIAGFSRGCAAEAIFAQMLYKNGLVYTDQDGVAHTLIQPGAVGAVSAALAIDPVLTGESGNMDFPPGIKNLTVVRAENEYRSLFKAAEYGADSDTVIDVPGSHSDAGDAYDNGLGGIYLGAYTGFFQNAGLHTLPVDSARQFISPTATPIVIHSESLTDAQIATEFALTGTLPAWEATYNPTNDLGVKRDTSSYGSPVTVSQNATNFTAYDGNIVVGGSGYSSSADFTGFVILPDSSASIGGVGDAITVNNGATLDFTSNVITSNETIRFSSDSAKLTHNGTVIIDEPLAFRGTIYGFVPSDTIDLEGIGTATGVALAANNMLNVSKANGTIINLQLDSTQNFSSDSFLITPDGAGGTKIVAEDDTQPISFSGTKETLLVVDPSKLSGTVSNFIQGDTIDLVGISATGILSDVNGVLSVPESGGGALTLNIAFDPLQEAGEAILATPTANGTELTVTSAFTYSHFTYGVAVAYDTTYAEAINNNGVVVGFTTYGREQGIISDYIYNDGIYTHITAADFPSDSGASDYFIYNTGINDFGMITGWGAAGAFIKSGGTATIIQVPGQALRPSAITNSGVVYGNGLGSDGVINGTLVITQGFSFANGKYSQLSYTDSSGVSIPAQFDSVSESGNFVLGSFIVPGSNTLRFFLHQQGTDVLLPDQLDGFYPYYMAVNDLGDLAGGIASTARVPYSYFGYNGDFLEKANGEIITLSPPYQGVLTNPAIASLNDSDQMVGNAGVPGSVYAFQASPVSEVISCFMSGTKIRAARGEVPVEELSVGDLVRARFACLAEVRWIGSRTVNCARHPHPGAIWPVRVQAGAFGPSAPV